MQSPKSTDSLKGYSQTEQCLTYFHEARNYILNDGPEFLAYMGMGDWYIELYLLGYPVEELLKWVLEEI